jgi:hypothetical protein
MGVRSENSWLATLEDDFLILEIIRNWKEDGRC